MACTDESADRMEGRRSIFLVPLPREGQDKSGEGEGHQENQGQWAGGITISSHKTRRVRLGIEVSEVDTKIRRVPRTWVRQSLKEKGYRGTVASRGSGGSWKGGEELAQDP